MNQPLERDSKTFLSPYKICFHTSHFSEWMNMGSSSPITMSFDLTLKCSYKCAYCPYRKFIVEEKFHTLDNIMKAIDNICDMGAKGILFTGGGEPLENPLVIEALEYAHNRELKIALITNGYKLNKDLVEVIINNCQWIRVSVDASNEKSYSKIHGVNNKHYETVLENITMLVDQKKNLKCDVTIGMGMVTHSNNIDEMVDFTKVCKLQGVDYSQFRPILYPTNRDVNAHTNDFFLNIQKCQELQDDKFRVIFSQNKYSDMIRFHNNHSEKCIAPNFANVVGADGIIYLCPHHRYKPEYAMGSVFSNSCGDERIDFLQKNLNKIDPAKCTTFCKHKALNNFLNSILNTGEHICFI